MLGIAGACAVDDRYFLRMEAARGDRPFEFQCLHDAIETPVAVFFYFANVVPVESSCHDYRPSIYFMVPWLCFEIDLTGADLTGADLTGANLYGAKLTGVRGLETVKGLASTRNLDKAKR